LVDQGDGEIKMADITVGEERKRRLDLWADLEARDLVAKARAEDLRQRHIYGGAQGIWVDKDRTGQIARAAASQSVFFILEGTIRTISPTTA
jgi:hypothetical protein